MHTQCIQQYSSVKQCANHGKLHTGFEQAEYLPMSADLKLPGWFSITKAAARSISEINDTLSFSAR